MGRRRHRHEEHANHEAWAIPYGDLVTLLLAFFVVMYAISSVNEGKYRVLSDSMVAAFRGTPRAPTPIQVGQRGTSGRPQAQVALPDSAGLAGAVPVPVPEPSAAAESAAAGDAAAAALEDVAGQVESALADLIADDLVVVRRFDDRVEVEIRTDILFGSGEARIADAAVPVIQLLARTLVPFGNDIRVEGHTDDRPIRNARFKSNWELSAARAASVVHLMTDSGMDAKRLSVLAFAEQRPLRPNDTEAGRNANRRVLLVIEGRAPATTPAAAPVAAPVAADSANQVSAP